MATNSIVYTGNLVEITLDSELVGMIQTLRASEDLGLQDVSGIGNVLVQEYVPSVVRYTLSVSVLQMRTQSLEKTAAGKQIANRTGSRALDGIVFDIIVRRKEDGLMLKRFINCSYGSGDIEVTKHQILGRNVTFMALDSDGDFRGGTYAPS